ncbi:FAD-dependent monooxygenase [Methylocella sp.]|uniref:FAD-dependent monooxygenase n=1 Tax=Methylocella sp. TaxID=1978226 RepID=UPI003783C3F7
MSAEAAGREGDRPHALIAGAGIGGLAAALRLAQAGWRVSLYDRAPVLAEVGAGLQLSPNATRVLRRLGALPALRGAALEPEAVRIRRARDGASLAVMPLGDAEARWGAPYLLAHRADLQRALLDAVATAEGVRLSTGVAVEGFEARPDGVLARLRKGESRFAAEGDCLVAADGSRSLLRGEMFGAGAQALAMSRRTAWRALVAADRAPAFALRPDASLWLGPRAHLVHYPLRGRSVVNVVAIVAGDETPDVGPFWSNDADARELLRRFAGWSRPALELLEAASGWRKWRLHDRAPLPRWTSGRVALLGDAAHPVLPFLAQGAAQAIEDADALGDALEGAAPVETALEAYQTRRIARASRVQKESRAQERIYHLSGPAAALRDLGLGAFGARLLAKYEWLYGQARP